LALRRPRLSGARSTSVAEGRIDFLDELDLGPLQEAVQLLDVGLIEVKLGNRRRDIGVREHTELLPAIDETLDLFEFLQFRY